MVVQIPIMWSMTQYRPRVVDRELVARLGRAGAVVVEGAKACGKTETARRVSASEVLLDVDADARRAMAIDPALVLRGAKPRLLDEWQVAPELWNHVRRAVDAEGTGQFILTGSAVPEDDVQRHTGAGRFSFLRMRPMSLLEAGASSGSVSLAGLMDGDPVAAVGDGLGVEELAGYVAVGGWPAALSLSVADAVRANRDYLQQIAEVDVSRVGSTPRDPDKVTRFMQSLARNVATEASDVTLSADTGGPDGSITRHTVADYAGALQRLMVTEPQPAWRPHLRSSATLRKAAKRHFVCPSLAVAALGVDADGLLRGLRLLGLLFESLVVRDLRVYSQPFDGVVRHYRDSYGVEVDAVVQDPSGRWAAFEVKLGEGQVDAAARSLLRFSAQVDHAQSGPPAALAIITGTGRYAYQRDDGIAVVPISALGP